MTPAEELFDTSNDPLELKNLANNPEHGITLKRMRKNYDAELAVWKKHAVPYNDYQRYGTLFDRKTSWSAKEKLAGSKPARKKKRQRK